MGDLLSFVLIFLCGVVSWCASTLAGGGGGTIFVPLATLILPLGAVTPATSVAGVISSSQRIFLYLKSINKELALLTVPFMILGSYIGAYIFSTQNDKTFAIFLAIFYIANGMSAFYKNKLTFKVRKWYFPVAGFVSAFLSGEIGVGGPFMNPFYINYGVKKEELLGTKAVCLMATQLTKIITYISFGVLNHKIMLIGVIAGAGALIGNYAGKRMILKISEATFRKFINASLLVCAFILLDKYWLNLF